ncbi:unnamed protein product [Brachionus calyciflorus]|uniref:J domain-containing protein n=1 Tax=Brachionus calyciflorus TaxID=104777 RepID=A0A813PAN3_9BILA|nr:unnamed protein product [Brachionus calyciflorus]
MWTRIEIISLKSTKLNTLYFRAYSRNSKDYYEVLDLKKNATKREIKQAYYRLSKKYHPDINKEQGSDEKFKTIHEAYEVLGDERKKLDYDMSSNQGFYPSASNTAEGFTPRAYKKRTGPVYSGSSHNFEEHFQAHYGHGMKKTPKAASASARGHHSYKMSEEELKNYWNTKEFSHDDYQTELRNDLFFRSLIVIVILVAGYLVIKKAKESEEKKGR